MIRILYLGYYFRKMNWDQFWSFLKHAQEETGRSRTSLMSEMVGDSLRYNISLLEYFQFRFYRRGTDKTQYAGTGYMYEYQKRMNPPEERKVLADKGLFLKEYAPFIHHEFALLDDLKVNQADHALLENPSGKIILKHSLGQCGEGIQLIPAAGLSQSDLIHQLEQTGNDIAEEFVVQHPDLQKLSSAGLNTVRIITQIDKGGNAEIVGARLRISVDSFVDNLAAGNMAAPINIASGKVSGPAVYSDIRKPLREKHPISDMQITGFQIPYWKACLEMAKEAALYRPENRSVGWDLAVTESGPDMIEGNHDWCKLLWQLPAGKGLKPILENYLNELDR